MLRKRFITVDLRKGLFKADIKRIGKRGSYAEVLSDEDKTNSSGKYKTGKPI